MQRCFPPAVLEQFLTGNLTEPAPDTVRAHVGGCTTCQAELDRLSDNPGVQAWVPHRPNQSPALAEEPALRRALEVLRTTPSPGAAEETVIPATGRFLPFLDPSRQQGDLDTLGPYRIQAELGRGGMGIVYRAQDTTLGRLVALKVLHPNLMADPLARQRFLREARAAAALRHDHIVVIYQVGEQGNTLFLAMEFLEGETLRARLRRQGTMPLEDVLLFGRETADGLASAHRAGLVHRDVKLANLWIEACPGHSPSTRLKILDFGLARATEPTEALTQTGLVVGTPDYMSPEQAGGEAVGPRSDLFSLGCVLYHLTTGVTPFPGDGLRGGHLETPQAPGLAELIERLRAQDPQDRPQSADEVVEALRAIESERTSPAVPVARHPPANGAPNGPRLRGKRGRLVLVAVLGLLLPGLGGVGYFSTLPQRFQPPSDGDTPELTRPKPEVPTEPFVLLGRDGPRDLGADVDVVGPGLPYEAWQKTADYQQWLSETGQKK